MKTCCDGDGERSWSCCGEATRSDREREKRVSSSATPDRWVHSRSGLTMSGAEKDVARNHESDCVIVLNNMAIINSTFYKFPNYYKRR